VDEAEQRKIDFVVDLLLVRWKNCFHFDVELKLVVWKFLEMLVFVMKRGQAALGLGKAESV